MTDQRGPEQPKPERFGIDDGAGNRTMQALIASAKVQEGVVMDDSQVLTDLQRRQIRERFKRAHADGDVSVYKAAKGVDENKSVLSQVVNDKYPQGKERGTRTIDRVLRKLDKWLSQREATARAPKRSGFVWTKVAEELRAVAYTTIHLQTIGVVYGQAGIGKSLALEALLSTFPGSILLTISDSSDSVPSFLRSLAGLLKLEVSRCRADNRRAICERLQDNGRLLMIDEAQLGDAGVLNTIRQIHDETGSPVLLAGQPSLARKLLQGRGDDHVGAMLYSRIGIVRDLEARCKGDQGEPLYSIADVQRVFAKSSIRIARDALDWLVGLSNLPDVGGLRAASNTLRLAEFVAGKSRGPVQEITLERLLQASRNLHGQERASAIANRVKEERKVA